MSATRQMITIAATAVPPTAAIAAPRDLAAAIAIFTKAVVARAATFVPSVAVRAPARVAYPALLAVALDAVAAVFTA